MNSLVTLIITQRESYARSLESLASILAHTPAPLALIYVDGASPPPVRDALRTQAATMGFRLLREEQILAPNQAKCLAIPFIETEFALFIDNDVLVEPDWLPTLLACAQETGAGAVAPLYLERVGDQEKLHMLGGRVHIHEAGGQRSLRATHDQRKGQVGAEPSQPFQTQHIEMHALLVRTALLHQHALFDPAILSVPENADFCLSLLEAGWQIWIEPRARVTVLLPEVLEADEGHFYKTRWSDEWMERGFAHFCQKWQLSGPQPALESQRRWVVAHRQVAYPDSLHRRLGIKSDSILNRRLLAPLEHRFFKR